MIRVAIELAVEGAGVKKSQSPITAGRSEMLVIPEKYSFSPALEPTPEIPWITLVDHVAMCLLHEAGPCQIIGAAVKNNVAAIVNNAIRHCRFQMK